MSSDSRPALTEKTPVTLTVRKLIVLVAGAVTLTATAVGYHLKTLNDIHASLVDVGLQIRSVTTEFRQQMQWQKESSWSLTDQSRWAAKLDKANDPVMRSDKSSGLIVPDPYEIHPLTAVVPVPVAPPP